MAETLLYGAVADDYTGAADLAGMLAERGVRTVQILGIQPDDFIESLRGRYQAAVIALKSRSIPAEEARRLSLQALRRLQILGPRQIHFKYCSTFDSTPTGNIGPVTESLMDALGADFTVAVPSLPVNGRTQYLGHLFVGSRLLSESPLRRHPVTPMTDSNLVRWLQAQTRKKVGLIPYAAVRQGAREILRAVQRLKREGIAIALVDVLSDEHLKQAAEAVMDFPLTTGGSGLGMMLPDLWEGKGWMRRAPPRAKPLRRRAGGVLILSGSCSAATLEQLRRLRDGGFAGRVLNPLLLLSPESAKVLDELCDGAARELHRRGVALIYSSAPAPERKATLSKARSRGCSEHDLRWRIEEALCGIALRLIEEGRVDSLIVAGGDTAGAVLGSLNLQALEPLASLDPGVPCLETIGPRPMTLVLKSGNFGAPDFFLKAIRFLKEGPAVERTRGG